MEQNHLIKINWMRCPPKGKNALQNGKTMQYISECLGVRLSIQAFLYSCKSFLVFFEGLLHSCHVSIFICVMKLFIKMKLFGNKLKIFHRMSIALYAFLVQSFVLLQGILPFWRASHPNSESIQEKDDTISIKNSSDMTIQDGSKANTNSNDEYNATQNVLPKKPPTPAKMKSFKKCCSLVANYLGNYLSN